MASGQDGGPVHRPVRSDQTLLEVDTLKENDNAKS